MNKKRSWFEAQNEESPFNLWDPGTRSYCTPTQKEVEWAVQRYQATRLTFAPSSSYPITNSPPTPVANTIGGQPTLSLAPEAMVSYPIAGNRYQNPRLPDPYSGQKWGMTDAPTMAQMIAVKEALGGMMDVRRIMFLQAFNVVELVVGDGRNYAQASLLGRVAGISTSYHHQQTLSEPIVPRQARRNPSPYARYACKHHNHDQCSNEPKRIQELDLGSAHPKARTTISMQENGHNVSKYDGKVWHPDDSTTRNGQVVGNVVQTYPELDLSVIKLKLNVQCTNSIYFMAERPVKFLKFDEVKFGDYFGVDGMTSGCMTVVVRAKSITPSLNDLTVTIIVLANRPKSARDRFHSFCGEQNSRQPAFQ